MTTWVKWALGGFAGLWLMGAMLPSPAPTPAVVPVQTSEATAALEAKPAEPSTETAKPTVQTKKETPADIPLSNNNYYTNVDGNQVHSPAYAPNVPQGASARCRDGTYSFSQNRRGTCSHHGGVAEWL